MFVVNLHAHGPAFEDAATNPVTLSEKDREGGETRQREGGKETKTWGKRALTCSSVMMPSYILTAGQHNRKKSIKSELLKVFQQMCFLFLLF